MSQLRKRRTREHIIADLSVNYVERLVLRCGWVARRIAPDYGIDLYMETYNANGEVENDGVWIQLKATDRLVVNRKQLVPVRLDWRDVLYWLNEWMPGILVIYDAQGDRAWRLHLQEALRTVSRESGRRLAHTLTLHVPLANVLDEAAIHHFAALRDHAVADRGDSQR